MSLKTHNPFHLIKYTWLILIICECLIVTSCGESRGTSIEGTWILPNFKGAAGLVNIRKSGEAYFFDIIEEKGTVLHSIPGEYLNGTLKTSMGNFTYDLDRDMIIGSNPLIEAYRYKPYLFEGDWIQEREIQGSDDFVLFSIKRKGEKYEVKTQSLKHGIYEEEIIEAISNGVALISNERAFLFLGPEIREGISLVFKSGRTKFSLIPLNDHLGIKKIAEKESEDLNNPKHSDEVSELVDGIEKDVHVDFESVQPKNNRSKNFPGQYPQASSRSLTRNELRGYSKAQLRIMRNEIFARYGYIFNSTDLRNHFTRQAWYQAQFKNVDNRLMEIEKANIKLIRELE